LFKSVCEQLSNIYDNNEETAINVSKSEEQPVTSTPLPNGTQMTRSGRKVVPPNRLQINNLTVDVLTAVITENVKKQLGYKRDNSENRSNSRNRGQDRESRKDKHEDKNRRTDSKNRNRTDSKGQRTNSRNRSDSQNKRPRSFSNRRERTKTWSDTDFAEARGIKCSRDYDPRRVKQCLKCLTEGTHHKFECKKYLRRSKYNCKNCNKGFHWAEKCDEPRKYKDSKNNSRNNSQSRSNSKNRSDSRSKDNSQNKKNGKLKSHVLPETQPGRAKRLTDSCVKNEWIRPKEDEVSLNTAIHDNGEVRVREFETEKKQE
jgi:hypothetical protein